MSLATAVLLGNALIRKIALEPLLTGPLLLLLIRKPEVFREHVLRRFPKLDNPKLVRALQWIVALGVGAKFGQLLNRWALNNWQLKAESSNWQWEKEIAVVTGGCSGIGEKISQGLAQKGLQVVVLDVQDLPKSLQNEPNITFHKVDITSPSALSTTADQIRSQTGHPSILINNAAVANGRTILDSSNESINNLFNVNIISHFYLIKEFLPHMIEKNKGHIVSVASMASFISCPNLVDYCAAKTAVLSLHEGLTQELKHRYSAPQVKTTVIHPMWVKTPLVSPWESQLVKHKIPLLPPSTVATAIVNQVLSGHSGQVFVPGVVSGFSGLRGCSHWLQEHLRDGTGRATGEEGAWSGSVAK